LRKECRLSVFENKVLRRIFGPKRDEVAGEWGRLHNKKVYALFLTKYPSCDQVKTTEMGRACSILGAYSVLVGKYEGKRPLGRSRHR
jgi:hypothetical protein